MDRLDELVERIKNESATPYFAAQYYSEQIVKLGGEPIKTIGCTPRESDQLFYACSYQSNHVNMWSPFVPKLFKRWNKTMDNKARGDEILKSEEFHIFHYNIKPRVVRKKAREMSKHVYKEGEEDKDFNYDIFINDFNKRFPKPTLIFPWFRGLKHRAEIIPQILSEKKLNSEIMDYLKREPESIFELLDKLWNTNYYTKEDKEQSRIITICDLVNRPRELTFKLEKP